MDAREASTDRIGPQHVGVLRAVARWMLPAGDDYTEDDVDLAAAILIPAVTAGHTRVQLRWGSTAPSRERQAHAPVIEVFEGRRLVAEIPWADLRIEDRPLRPPSDLFATGGW